MNRRIILFAVLVCLFKAIGASETEFEHLISEDKVWEYRYGEFYWGSGKHKYRSDFIRLDGVSIINGKEYHNVFIYPEADAPVITGNEPYAYIREKDGEVFMLRGTAEHYAEPYAGSGMYLYLYGDTVHELKIYDFNMMPNDSLCMMDSNVNYDMPPYIFWYGGSSIKLDRVTTEVFEGINRKIQYISAYFGGDPEPHWTFRVVEGIGIEDGGYLFTPYSIDDRSGGRSTLELVSVRTRSGEWIYRIPGYTSIEIADKDNKDSVCLKDDALAVEASGEWTLSVYTVSGHLVSVHTGAGHGCVYISSLPSGVYIACLKTNDSTKNIKFVR